MTNFVIRPTILTVNVSVSSIADMEAEPSARNSETLFRLALLALLIGQMFVYYDASTKTIPRINVYLIGNLALILLVLAPWRWCAALLWVAAWPLGALMRLDWATRSTNSDVFWATSQGVDFLLHGMNPYTQVYTWVYQHQPGISNYPAYSYFPGGLFAEAPFYLLGNVRLGLALTDISTALLLYLLARSSSLGEWPARTLAVGWLLFLPGFQVTLLLGALDFFLLFWVALSVWCYARGWAVVSALAAAMAFSTKQYGFLFALPWAIFMVKPLVLSVWERWRSGKRSLLMFSTIPRQMWLAPTCGFLLAAVVVLPLALLSPKAFVDATIFHHTTKQPSPMLGTPQWNESIPAQAVALGWVRIDDATRVASLAFPILLLGLTVVAALKIQEARSALMWSTLLSGALFAVNGGDVQFFYWRLVLLLFILYFVLGYDVKRENDRS